MNVRMRASIKVMMDQACALRYVCNVKKMCESNLRLNY